MGIQLSGFNSGLPVEDMISQLMSIERRPIDLLEQRKSEIQLQQGIYSNVKSRVSDLLASLEVLSERGSFLGGEDVFMAKTSASADEAVATAAVTSQAGEQTVSLEVLQLASATKATSQSPVGQTITGASLTTEAARGTIEAGDFTVFINGVANTISVAADGVETVQDVLDSIRALDPNITGATVNGNGELEVTYDSSAISLQFGATDDSSNFLTATNLLTATSSSAPPLTTLTGSAPVMLFSASEDITTADTNVAVAAGSQFSINGVTFDVGNKSLNSIINEINNSSAGVSASFDPAGNTLNLIADDPGSTFISLEDTAGNFLAAMGLITGGDTTSSQTVGNNAQFNLNGSTYYSPTNTVGEDITGLIGVTLSLKAENIGSPIDITIGRDTQTLTGAIEDFVKKFNDVIIYIDEQTKADPENPGPLSGESSLKRLRQQLRQLVTDAIGGLSGEAYDSLQVVGISTGEVTGALNVSSTIQFDSTKFLEALETNFDNVYQLFKGTTADDGFDGTITRIQNVVDAALETTDGSEGIFAAYEESSASRIESLDDAIARGEERLIRKEDLLRQQFLMMERMIAQFQQQGTALTGLQQQLAANG